MAYLAICVAAAMVAAVGAGDLRGAAFEVLTDSGHSLGQHTNASVAMLAQTDTQQATGLLCDRVEQFYQAYVKNVCKVDKDVTCVVAKLPQCSFEDICKGRNGCAYVEDNVFLKFTGYTCIGHRGVDQEGDHGVLR